MSSRQISIQRKHQKIAFAAAEKKRIAAQYRAGYGTDQDIIKALPQLLTYYTINTPYEKLALQLQADCERLGIKITVIGRENLGSRHQNQRQKVYVLKDFMDSHQQPFVWIDADSRLWKHPVLFIDALKKETDFMAPHIHEGSHVGYKGGVMFFNNSDATRKLLDWMTKIADFNPLCVDEPVINLAVEQVPELDIVLIDSRGHYYVSKKTPQTIIQMQGSESLIGDFPRWHPDDDRSSVEKKNKPLSCTLPAHLDKKPKKTQRRHKSFDKFVTVSLASIPERVETLQKVVVSLLPQVDKLNVYLNNYQNVPAFLNHKKIEVARSQDHGDLKDNGKFWWAEKVRGYHLTCDDDVDYPPDYVEKMIAAIERYERKAIISCHGSVIPHNFRKYYGQTMPLPLGVRKVFGAFKELKEDLFVHIPGTGSMGYHSDGCHLSMEHFPKFINADVFVGIYAQRSCTPVICMAHKKDWLSSWEYKDSISQHSSKRTNTTMDSGRAVTELVLSQQPWKLNEYKSLDKSVTVTKTDIVTRQETPQKVVSVLIAAYKAEQWIEGCVKNVLEQELPEGWKLEIIVGVDGCHLTWAAVNRIKDPRLGSIFFSENNGTYITFNSIVPHSCGTLIVRHDADDLMGEGRLSKMINCFIEDPSLVMVGTSHQLMSADMSKILKSRMYPVEGCWMWSRSIWDKLLGGFEPWQCGADSEILARAQLGLNLPLFVIKDPSLYLYRQHDTSLYKNPETGLGSSIRHRYGKIVLDRRKDFANGEKPKRLNPKIIKEDCCSGLLFRDSVTVSIASIPERVDTLQQTVNSLLPQVDKLNVYLNNYVDVPLFLTHKKIEVFVVTTVEIISINKTKD